MAVAVGAGVIAKPPPVDEGHPRLVLASAEVSEWLPLGMEATVTLSSPEAKYQLARQTKGFAQAY